MLYNLKNFYVKLLLNCVCFVFSTAARVVLKDEFKDILKDVSNVRAPFFELPCMKVDGICSREFACPPGTRVMQKDLCPKQQHLGMECCKPFKMEKKCSAIYGTCMPEGFECSNRITKGIDDCLPTEICCLEFVHLEKKCTERYGTCVPRTYDCPNRLTKDITDCKDLEICCLEPGQ